MIQNVHQATDDKVKRALAFFAYAQGFRNAKLSDILLPKGKLSVIKCYHKHVGQFITTRETMAFALVPVLTSCGQSHKHEGNEGG